MAIKTDIDYAVGDNVILRMTISGETDVTSFTFAYSQQVKESLIEKTTGSGIAGTVGDLASIDITLTATDTDIPPGTGEWAVRRTNAGSEARMGHGRAEVAFIP